VRCGGAVAGSEEARGSGKDRPAGCFATRVNIESSNSFEVGTSTGVVQVNRGVLPLESYPWSPFHDQCGMLRPFGTSSAEWW